MKKFILSLIGIVMFATGVVAATGSTALGLTVAFASLFAGSNEVGVLSVNGFRPALLKHLSMVTQENTPQNKLDPFGFLGYLYSQRKPQVLRLDTEGGHQETVRVKYLQRLTESHTRTDISCDYTNIMPYQETSVELSSTRSIAIHLGDETVAKYTDDASKMVSIGSPTTAVMDSMVERIIASANAILSGVNQDLITSLSTSFGVNRRTGSNAASTININKDSTINPLTDGLTQMMADYKLNRGNGKPSVIGSGLMYNHVLQQLAKSPNQSGLNTKIELGQFDFWYDLDAQNILGANQVAMVENGSLGIVEYMQYKGFKAGVKPGASQFGTLMLPFQAGEFIVPIEFDYQLRYNDCQETLTDGYYGGNLVVQKGYNLIISKQSGLFTIPTGAYRGTDPLSGNRGTYRYTISNDCETCS